ncbi:hypothetical protein MRB53_038235 [Persea americana]|nr:hypothetical protein MRB53_038235 [Persea americana]
MKHSCDSQLTFSGQDGSCPAPGYCPYAKYYARRRKFRARCADDVALVPSPTVLADPGCDQRRARRPSRPALKHAARQDDRSLHRIFGLYSGRLICSQVHCPRLAAYIER